jgi:hypothetical protein
LNQICKGTAMKLTQNQAERLHDVATAQAALVSARTTIKVELERRLTAELATLEARRDMAAYRAFLAGVPKSRIGKDALHTSAAITYNAVIDSGAALLDDEHAEKVAPAEKATQHRYVGATGAQLCEDQPFSRSGETVTFTGGPDWGEFAGQRSSIQIHLDGADLAFSGDEGWTTPAGVLLFGAGEVSEALRHAAKNYLTRSEQ